MCYNLGRIEVPQIPTDAAKQGHNMMVITNLCLYSSKVNCHLLRYKMVAFIDIIAVVDSNNFGLFALVLVALQNPQTCDTMWLYMYMSGSNLCI